MLEQLEEYPLRPLIVRGVRGIHDAVPVKAIAQHFQLPGKVLDILLCDDGGVDMVLNGKILRRQAKRIKADGKQDVIALHTLFARHNVHCRKRARMADVQPRRGRIRKLNEAVEFLFILFARHGGIGLRYLPIVLPFLLNGRKIVLHRFGCSLSVDSISIPRSGYPSDQFLCRPPRGAPGSKTHAPPR